MRKHILLKRAISFSLCAIFVLSAFAGCSSKKSTEEPSTPSSPAPQSPSSELVESSGENSGINTDKVDAPVTTFSDDETFVKMTDIELSRYAGAEGMVLLENSKNILPLTKSDTVALFGEAQINFIKGGTGSGDVNALYIVNALEGLRNKEKEGKIKIYAPLAEKYEEKATYSPKTDEVAKIAKEANKAVVFISRNSGENIDVTETKYYLSSTEKMLLDKVCKAGFQGVTVVLNIGTVMDTSFLKDYPAIDSLLIAWQPGMEGGNALADVLVGDVNPSGKLSDTMASSYKDYPSASTFNSSSVYATYGEDIYVGYRYFETFDPEYKKVNYSFGYGLSYTTFEVGEPSVKCDGTYIEVTVKVTNTGSVPGMEVVQTYYSAPQGKLGAPGKVLAAFAKTKLLAPGESQTVKMTFAVTDMARFDDVGKIKQYAWLMEAGTYGLYVGNSIKNAGERGVCYTYELKEDTITLQLTDLLSEVTLKGRLTSNGSYEEVYTGPISIALPEGKTIVSACDYLVQYNQTQLDASPKGDVYGMSETGGQSLIYTFTPKKAGTYTLTLGYALIGNKTTEDAFIVTVNGTKAKETPDLVGTGGKFKVGYTDAITLKLEEGVNKVEVKIDSKVKETLLLCTLTLDDSSGKGTTSLLATPQKVVDPKEEMSFLEVYEDPSKLDEFIDTLSPSEMIYLLCGHAPNVGHGDGSLAGLTAKDVPFVDTSDGPAGLDLSVKQVAWPIETALSCTWNTQLIYQVGQKVGEECYTAGVDIWLAPGINIHRDPLGGRNFEYFSEDPLLTGKMASAITQGVQSVKGAGVMIKHLYANSRESGRVDGDSHISLRAAREVYLKAFEICIKEADPWSVMTTYNTSNGTFNSENKDLLTGILRDEWGFKGFVCTDWGAHSQQFREIAAGNDAKMSWGYPESTLAAYRAGALSHEALRASAKRMLEIALKSGSLERALNPVIPVHTVLADATTRIKAAELATRSEGIGFEECLDEDGGIIPNYTQDGKSVTYQVDVQKADTYQFVFRVASENRNSMIRVLVDGEQVGVFRWLEGSGGWQTWVTEKPAVKARLTKGEHTIEFVFGTAMNVNWFELVPQ
ncbi:MAG: glycoside hydrolase family 3 C-terminal domain-containing protein [Clostridia bacterium]|nr:glycoside hydrolase family 3 C-terminal domain-containing protein [Clostridia bacterium]